MNSNSEDINHENGEVARIFRANVSFLEKVGEIAKVQGDGIDWSATDRKTRAAYLMVSSKINQLSNSKSFEEQIEHLKVCLSYPFIGNHSLFLRPFKKSRKFNGILSSGKKVKYEVALAEAMDEISLVIGAASQLEDEFGTIKFTNEQWKLEIIDLIKSSVPIFIIPSAQPNLVWELDTIYRMGALKKSSVCHARQVSRCRCFGKGFLEKHEPTDA